MKKIFVLIFVSVLSVSWSQDRRSIDYIKSNSNIKELESLKIKFQDKFEAESLLISEFLKNNSSYQKSFTIDGVLYDIYTIIDGKPVYRTTDNINSAKATKTNSLQVGGDLGLNLTGNGMYVGVWDGGSVLKTHVEFQNGSTTRIITPDNLLSSTHFHATHVAGTIAASGVDNNAKGMATESIVLSYNWANDYSEVLSEINDKSLLLSNHSYGVPVLDENGNLNVPAWVMGCYSSEAQQWDQLAYNAPYYLMVVSAGNSGADSYTGGMMEGFDKLTHEKNSKNNLVVANANPFLSPVNGALISVVVNSTSSQGPSHHGRIKPDIAGDGTNVFSTYDDNNNSYGTASGTSMASPNLTGSLLLLQEYYHQLHDVYMRAATIKGLVCHTAFDAGAVGPDPRFGYGLLDAKQSAETIAAASLAVPLAVVDELVLNQGDVYSFEVFVDNPKKLKATISWTDVPGANKNNQLNSQTPVLVNDLDLRITKNEEVNYPWKLQLSDISAPSIKGDNIVDNVEKVEVDNASGTYTIQVSHKGNLVNGPQAYSLIVTGVDSVTLSNNSIDRNLISVFPNPVNNMLNVNSDAYTFKRYDVYDFQGRLVQSGVIQEQSDFQINVSPLSSGMYILNLVSDEGVYVEKIVKK